MKTWRDTVHQAVYENDSGLASSTRIALLLASGTLSFSLVLLTFAVWFKPELMPALSVVAGSLGGASGMSYVAGRAWSTKRSFREMEHE